MKLFPGILQNKYKNVEHEIFKRAPANLNGTTGLHHCLSRQKNSLSNDRLFAIKPIKQKIYETASRMTPEKVL